MVSLIRNSHKHNYCCMFKSVDICNIFKWLTKQDFHVQFHKQLKELYLQHSVVTSLFKEDCIAFGCAHYIWDYNCLLERESHAVLVQLSRLQPVVLHLLAHRLHFTRYFPIKTCQDWNDSFIICFLFVFFKCQTCSGIQNCSVMCETRLSFTSLLSSKRCNVCSFVTPPHNTGYGFCFGKGWIYSQAHKAS